MCFVHVFLGEVGLAVEADVHANNENIVLLFSMSETKTIRIATQCRVG